MAKEKSTGKSQYEIIEMCGFQPALVHHCGTYQSIKLSIVAGYFLGKGD